MNILFGYSFAQEILALTLELKVLKSAAGWSIGPFDHDDPVSRGSQDYYPTESLAKQAFESDPWG